MTSLYAVSTFPLSFLVNVPTSLFPSMFQEPYNGKKNPPKYFATDKTLI